MTEMILPDVTAGMDVIPSFADVALHGDRTVPAPSPSAAGEQIVAAAASHGYTAEQLSLIHI